MANPVIREATVADARALAEVHVEGWRWAYRGLFPDEVIDALDIGRYEEQWIRGFTDDWRDGDACFVAEGDETVIGFVACGPASDEHAAPPPGAGEVQLIYVRERVRGTGVGRALLARAEDALHEHGFENAVLWVFEKNDLARRFYERAGWTWDGTRSEHRFDFADVPVLRYSRPDAN